MFVRDLAIGIVARVPYLFVSEERDHIASSGNGIGRIDGGQIANPPEMTPASDGPTSVNRPGAHPVRSEWASKLPS
jgi:hypothetical protein